MKSCCVSFQVSMSAHAPEMTAAGDPEPLPPTRPPASGLPSPGSCSHLASKAMDGRSLSLRRVAFQNNKSILGKKRKEEGKLCLLRRKWFGFPFQSRTGLWHWAGRPASSCTVRLRAERHRRPPAPSPAQASSSLHVHGPCGCSGGPRSPGRCIDQQ